MLSELGMPECKKQKSKLQLDGKNLPNSKCFYFTGNSLVLDEGLHQLRPQSTESVREAPWKPRGGLIILRPTFFYTTLLLLVLCTAFIALLFFSDCLDFCLRLWAEVGISRKAPEHVQYVEPPISAQQSLSVHRGEQWHFVIVGPHQNMSLQRETFGRLSQELEKPSALGGLLGSCIYPVQQASRVQKKEDN